MRFKGQEMISDDGIESAQPFEISQFWSVILWFLMVFLFKADFSIGLFRIFL